MKEVELILKSLKHLRQTRGISSEEICRESGLSAQQVSQIESGKRDIRLKTFLRYLQGSGVIVSFAYETNDGRQKIRRIYEQPRLHKTGS